MRSSWTTGREAHARQAIARDDAEALREAVRHGLDPASMTRPPACAAGGPVPGATTWLALAVARGAHRCVDALLETGVAIRTQAGAPEGIVRLALRLDREQPARAADQGRGAASGVVECLIERVPEAFFERGRSDFKAAACAALRLVESADPHDVQRLERLATLVPEAVMTHERAAEQGACGSSSLVGWAVRLGRAKVLEILGRRVGPAVFTLGQAAPPWGAYDGELLLGAGQGAGARARVQPRHTALGLAVALGCPQRVEAIVGAGADADAPATMLGHLPLTLALGRVAAEWREEGAGRSGGGWRVLDEASPAKALALVDCLLEAGANPARLDEAMGRTGLEFARETLCTARGQPWAGELQERLEAGARASSLGSLCAARGAVPACSGPWL